MIKANELRVGNWLFGMFNTNDGFVMQPLEISPDVISEIYEGVSDYDPIPITEEWLLRFGFEKKIQWWRVKNDGKFDVIENQGFELNKCIKNDDGRYHDVYFSYDSVSKKLNCYSSDGGDDTTVFADIKYVHQLQNLYFAITEKEI